MKHPAIAVVLRSLLVVVAVCATLPAAAADTLATRFLLLAGHPSAEPGATDRGVLVIPGLVMPLGEAAPGRSVEADSQEIAAVARKLESTLRLDSVEVLYVQPQLLDVGREVTLPPPSAASSVRVEVVLQGYNDEAATYRVRFRDGRSTFVDSVVSVPRQKRALVGGLDGGEAPYLFLVVEPEPRARYVGTDITPPRAVDRPAPRYTSEAREARIQGVVIVQAEIDRQGRVRDTKVLKGLPMGLSESAAETVSGWRFEPALDADGEPIDVFYNLTINFRLESEPDSESVRRVP